MKVITSGQDLQKYVAEPEQEAISEAIKSIQNRWDEVMCHAPLHLLKVHTTFIIKFVTYSSFILEMLPLHLMC